MLTSLANRLLATVALVAALATAAVAAGQSEPAPAPWTVQLYSLPITGTVLTDGYGIALYIYDGDQPGVSSCDQVCGDTWRPLLTSGDLLPSPDLAGRLGTVTLSNGSLQVTYYDRPLYQYAGDLQPSDLNGDGIDNLWHVARPGLNNQPPPGVMPPRPLASQSTFRALDHQNWQPITASVDTGATVTWENDDPTSAHAVQCIQAQSSAPCPWTGTLPLPAPVADGSGVLQPWAVSVTFSEPGLYTFRCTIFPNMLGQVTVGASMAPGAPGAPGGR